MHLRLENFDGPLDLLLHLIKVQDLNIFNIPIEMITRQFLSFIKQVPELDFHQAGEYLATAAQLIEIKAHMLVPVLQKNHDAAKTPEELHEEDPRKPLVEQLIEYESIKKASKILENKEQLQKNIFPSAEFKRREGEFSQFEHPIKGNPFDLVIAFERILLKFSTQKTSPRVLVKAQKITIQQKMIFIKKHLENVQSITLKVLMVDCLSRYEFIVTIMALLELCKARHLEVHQEQTLSEIQITRSEKFFEDSSALHDIESTIDSEPTPLYKAPLQRL